MWSGPALTPLTGPDVTPDPNPTVHLLTCVCVQELTDDLIRLGQAVWTFD